MTPAFQLATRFFPVVWGDGCYLILVSGLEDSSLALLPQEISRFLTKIVICTVHDATYIRHAFICLK